jgi:hypothetical protein
MAIIDKPTDHFNTVLYTGNSNVTQTISGVGFQPDLTWIKNRDNVEYHHLADVVRGANKFIHSNATDVERTGSKSNGYNTMAFTADGFSLTNPTAQDSELNFGSRTYASWNWKAGGTAVSNTDGSITSSVSANTTSGFSIVSYTGTGAVGDIGHGLGSTPKMIIKKRRNGADAWNVWHESLGDGSKALYLNTTNATDTNANYASNVPTSSLFYVGTDSQINASGGTYIAYCFAEVKGFSKFGSYTGNGSADGTFVYTGFKPAFVLVKNTQEAAAEWRIIDNKRSDAGGFNLIDKTLDSNNSDAELDAGSTWIVDFLSNGFKWRINTATVNAVGENHIYMAFAEQPFVTSTANGSIPATAR